MTRRAVFLDRDGTVIAERGYLLHPQQAELIAGARQGLAELKALGYLLVVVTNQSAVARGLCTEEAVEAANARVNELLGPAARIDRFFVCPHLPEGIVPEFAIECGCRKPKPGLVRRAEMEMKIDLGASYLVGDSIRDLAAGRAAGVRTVLVMTGLAAQSGGPPPSEADHVAGDLPEAARWIARQGPSGRIH